MSEAATPAVPNNGTPTVVPAATPANSQPEKVTLDKAAHDQLVKDAARASEAQSRADRYEGILKKNGLIGGGHFKPAAPVTPPSPEDRAAQAAEEDRKAERGLIALALDPVYREVLDKDPTLRDLLTKNPLAILPVLAPDALDADDAVSLVREALNKRKPATPPANPPANPPAPSTPPTPQTPPPGGVNPPSSSVPNEEYEAARKNPNTETAIAGMIKAKTKAGGK